TPVAVRLTANPLAGTVAAVDVWPSTPTQLRVTMVLAVANCSLIGLQLTLQLALHPPVDATTMRVLSNCNWWPSIGTVTAGSAECLDVSRAVTSTLESRLSLR